MVNGSILNQRLEKFQSALREAGLRATPQRLEIFRIVASSEEHPGAEEILKKLHKRHPMVSLDTVYRTLWMLADLGLIRTVDPRREHIRFDANLSHHHHFTCLRCGGIRDFESPKLDEIPIPGEARVHGQPVSLHVEVRGICNACLKNEPQQRIQANKEAIKQGE